MKAGIFGIGSALPEHVITNADLEARLDTTAEWILKRTGIQTRHHLNGAGTLGDLATDACMQALRDAGREAADVDHVIVATITPDRLFPGIAPDVASQLGCHGAAAVDFSAACAGFVYALDFAAALVETGRAQLVLAVGADALSRITDHDDRTTAVLFGDGVGAVVIAAAEVGRGISAFVLGADGTRADMLYADRTSGVISMDGREVYLHAVDRMAEATREALRLADLTIGDLDLFVVHQANKRIVEAAARRLGVPDEKLYMNIADVANTSSASIPIALHQAEREGRLKPGDIVGLAAFGGGFVWGAGVIAYKERARVAA